MIIYVCVASIQKKYFNQSTFSKIWYLSHINRPKIDATKIYLAWNGRVVIYRASIDVTSENVRGIHEAEPRLAVYWVTRRCFMGQIDGHTDAWTFLVSKLESPDAEWNTTLALYDYLEQCRNVLYCIHCRVTARWPWLQATCAFNLYHFKAATFIILPL